MSETLKAAIADWIEQDPDPATVAELQTLVEQADSGGPDAAAELASAFAGPLHFGTAGLRAALGPGPARMNRVVVARAAAGLGKWLDGQGLSGGKVIIGYDGRHNSDVFARDSAELLAAAGFDVLLTDQVTPTPVVAFGIKHYRCVAGIVVTASHNPPQDNGYKVYLGDGSQIIPPTDVQIAACIAEVAALPITALARSQDYKLIGADLHDAYVAMLADLVPPAPNDLAWAYTAMHGVGYRFVAAMAQACGFADPFVVLAQANPDPDFPTVAFPNPEEPGAMDLVIALAQQQGADLAIATDPDADRCAVAAPVRGVWRRLTGDEVGILLGDDALRRNRKGTFAASLVSSSRLGTMAQAQHRDFQRTLTGFKWIGRVPDLAFGYEEALGYCCDARHVSDKDGISAAACILRLAAELKAEHRTLADRLDELDLTFGVHATKQVAIRVEELERIGELMAHLMAHLPTELGGEAVNCVDLSAGIELPPTEGLEFSGASVHVVVRPSGTEPKLKCYLEVRRPAAEAVANLATSRQLASEQLEQVTTQVKQALGLD